MKTEIISPDTAQEFFIDEQCHILEVLNSADDPAVSIARARVEPGVSTRPHTLEGTTERYLIVSGTGTVRVGDLVDTDVAAGDVVVIPANTGQSVTNTGNEDLVFYAICTPRFTPECYQAL